MNDTEMDHESRISALEVHSDNQKEAVALIVKEMASIKKALWTVCVVVAITNPKFLELILKAL